MILSRVKFSFCSIRESKPSICSDKSILFEKNKKNSSVFKSGGICNSNSFSFHFQLLPGNSLSSNSWGSRKRGAGISSFSEMVCDKVERRAESGVPIIINKLPFI